MISRLLNTQGTSVVLTTFKFAHYLHDVSRSDARTPVSGIGEKNNNLQMDGVDLQRSVANKIHKLVKKFIRKSKN